jgi:ferrous iron transport protein A
MAMRAKKDLRPFPLMLAGEDERVKIVLFRGGKNLEKRLTSMGLNIGRTLRVLTRTGRNMVVLCGETRLALGSPVTHKILVVHDP